jgi:alanyl-tRNA synthetase
MGIVEQIRTIPMAVADPVFSSTHQANAIVLRLSPRREMVCPVHSSANERFVSDLKKFIKDAFSSCFTVNILQYFIMDILSSVEHKRKEIIKKGKTKSDLPETRKAALRNAAPILVSLVAII